MYRNDLDVIKGFSIIAVILFHLGIVKSGYLGVDAFLVINGFLIIPSILRKISNCDFSYFDFLIKRILRLWPMVIIATFACLVIGYFGMLPDDFENVGESVVASNMFSENILLSLTTKDYWNVANDYNPLMHLWYVGILFEFYVLFPVIIMVWNIVVKFVRVGSYKDDIIIFLLFVVSLFLYFSSDSDGEKFYYVPFRFFEFMAGGLVALMIERTKIEGKLVCQAGVVTLLFFFMFSSTIYLDSINLCSDVRKIGDMEVVEMTYLVFSKSVMLILIVILTSVSIFLGSSKSVVRCAVLEYLGKRSYSLFIWHQIMIAFYRYFVSNEVTVSFVIGFIVILIALSELTYRYIEKKIKTNVRSLAICAVVSILVITSGGLVYMRAGVVRNVPELDISMNSTHRGMHAEYVDRAYAYDKDFGDNNKRRKVLVFGNSYGRDMCNVLLESSYRDSIELSYVFGWNELNKNRISKADYLFLFYDKKNVPSFVWEMKKPNAEVYGIGTKNYGQSNGIIYSHRFSNDYTMQTITLHPWYKAENDKWKINWGDHYIDFLDMAIVENNRVRVFTDDGKFISQDCYHLSPPGAKWYASKIDFSRIFK